MNEETLNLQTLYKKLQILSATLIEKGKVMLFILLLSLENLEWFKIEVLMPEFTKDNL